MFGDNYLSIHFFMLNLNFIFEMVWVVGGQTDCSCHSSHTISNIYGTTGVSFLSAAAGYLDKIELVGHSIQSIDIFILEKN